MQNTKARVACDACRLRKIRCSRLTSTAPNDAPSCDACSRTSESCTFQLPVKRRGPKPKSLRRFSTSFASSSSSPDGAGKRVASPHDVSQTAKPLASAFQPDARLAVEHFCSPAIRHKLIQEFLDRIHVLIPIVHAPTFNDGVMEHRYERDAVFAALVMTICSLVVATMPRTVSICKALDPSFKYQSNRDCVDTAKRSIQNLQSSDYYHTLTVDKWTIAYGMGLAMVQMGFLNEGKKYHAEANMILLEMGANRAQRYEKLDNVDAQMLKKAFWIDLSGQSHYRLSSLRWDSISARFAFENSDAEHLFPLQLDDENITRTSLHQPSSNRLPRISGLLASIQLHLCLCSIVEESCPVFVTWFEAQQFRKRIIGNCQCGRHISPASSRDLIEYRLHKVQSLLEQLPPELHLRQQDSTLSSVENDLDHVLAMQYESMAANIHITTLWVQSMLSESLISMSEPIGTSSYDVTSSYYERAWQMREEICRQLLNAIKKLSPLSMEPSGLVLLYKIRQVAATLMEYKFGLGNQVSLHAELYSKAFAERLGELFLSGDMPTQTGGIEELNRYEYDIGLEKS